MGSPTNALIGLYMLWWGWLAFNAGSTFGSDILFCFSLTFSCLYFSVTDNKWQLSARACCTTLMASVAGGWVALVQSYFMNNKKQDVLTVVNGILGALVGVTGGCAVFNVYSSMVVGAVGSFLANITPPLLEYWRLHLVFVFYKQTA